MFVNNMEEALKALKIEVEKLEEQSNLIIQKKAKVEIFNINNKLYYFNEYHFYIKKYFGEEEVKNITEVETAFNNQIKKLNEVKIELEELHKKNEKFIEHNKKIVKSLEKIMNKIGIPSTYYEYYYKTKRSRKKTKILRRAGYLLDIERCIITNDQYKKHLDLIENKEKKLKELKNKYISKFKKIEIEQEKKEKEKKLNRLLINLYNKYDIEYDLTEELSIDFLIENLRNKDKYLDLAIALEDNRADWNDGYSIVENSIENFKIENDIDHNIYNEITSVIYENWGGDGRVFRDINYSYTTLYNMVDEKLLEDFNKLKEFKIY